MGANSGFAEGTGTTWEAKSAKWTNFSSASKIIFAPRALASFKLLIVFPKRLSLEIEKD